MLTRSFLLAILVFLAISWSEARKITLDRASDRTKEFLEVDCHYSEGYEDFWIYGCKVEPTVSRGEVGFWTPCYNPCQIIYYGGILPRLETLVVEAFVHGSSEIQILGSASLTNMTAWETITTIPATSNWISVSVDISEFPDLHIFSVSPIPSADGFVLIDKIVVDLGDDVPDLTTESPPPITPSPETVGLIPLDKDNDNSKFWQEVLCHYASDYEDFELSWGCPTPLATVAAGVESDGYWTSCQRESCDMMYYGSIVSPPLSLKFNAYIKGSAVIRIIGKRSKYDHEDFDRHLYTISANNALGYCNSLEELDLVAFGDIYGASVRLVSSHDGFVLVDRLTVQLKSGVEDEFHSPISGDIPCNVFIEPEPTDAPVVPTTRDPIGPVPTTKDPVDPLPTTKEPVQPPVTQPPSDDAGFKQGANSIVVTLFVFAAMYIKFSM